MSIHALQGIALDIDDTLSDTQMHFIRRLNEVFPNPEGLTPEEIQKKYRIIPHISYWQTPEVKDWLEIQATSNEAQEAVTPIEGAAEAVQKMAEIVPVRMYITSRPSLVVEGTKRWLAQHGFPEAEVVTRPYSLRKIDGNAWKAEILKKFYPSIGGIVDDNPEVIAALGQDYQGTIFLFGDHFDWAGKNSQVVHCPTWESVLEALKQKS